MAQIEKELDQIRRRYGSLETYVAKTYGQGVPFSVIGDFCLVHLDKPDDEEMKRRLKEFDPNNEFPDDCPICEMEKERGGFIVYDGNDKIEDYEDDGNYDIDEIEDKVILETQKVSKDSLWRRSYLNMEGFGKANPELKVNMLQMHLWGNIVEMQEDLENEAVERAKELRAQFKIFLKDVQPLVLMPEMVTPWTEIAPAFEKVKRTATGLTNTMVAEKVRDFCEKLDLFADSVQELIIERSLLRN